MRWPVRRGAERSMATFADGVARLGTCTIVDQSPDLEDLSALVWAAAHTVARAWEPVGGAREE